jgi:predicted amidophosphoribosyltransferase
MADRATKKPVAAALTRWTATLTGLIAPPRCGVCAAACALDESICGACAADLARSRGRFLLVPGADVAWSATSYDGTAQQLVSALKFAGRLRLAGAAAEAIASSIPPGLAAGAVVPVPPAPGRRRNRGFDPTALIATALAVHLDLPHEPCLDRSDGPRQVGRPRRQRLADPPLVRAIGPAPEVATLIDDVTTTGATLAACALSLRAAGSRRVIAVTFARTPGR